MPDEISGMGKTHGNACLICKNLLSTSQFNKMSRNTGSDLILLRISLNWSDSNFESVTHYVNTKGRSSQKETPSDVLNNFNSLKFENIQ
jgi:hypothetical protein